MLNSSSFLPKKILIIKLKKLGDVLGTTPCVRQIKTLYSNSEITFLSEPLGAQVYEYSNWVSEVWVLSRKPTVGEYLKMIGKINRAKFDVVIDLYHHSKTALMAIFSGAKHRLGFTHKNEKVWSYNYTVSLTNHEKREVSRTHHQLKLTNLLGTTFDDDALEFLIDEKTKKFGEEFITANGFTKNTIAFCVQSERADAQVPLELWVKIGNYLLEQGKKLFFIYGPGERAKAESIYDLLGDTSQCIINYDVPRVAEVRAILEYCEMFIGNDGGNKHLAVAAGIATVGLFFGDNPKVWTPKDNSRHRFLQTRENATSFEDFMNTFELWDAAKNKFINQ